MAKHFSMLARKRVQAAFLCRLRAGWPVTRAAARSDASLQTLYVWRRADPTFAVRWDAACEAGARVLLDRAAAVPLGAKIAPHIGHRGRWHSPEARRRFLQVLREGGTVRSAARMAAICRETAFQWRKRDIEFAAAWQAAHDEGTAALLRRAREEAGPVKMRALYEWRVKV